MYPALVPLDLLQKQAGPTLMVRMVPPSQVGSLKSCQEDALWPFVFHGVAWWHQSQLIHKNKNTKTCLSLCAHLRWHDSSCVSWQNVPTKIGCFYSGTHSQSFRTSQLNGRHSLIKTPCFQEELGVPWLITSLWIISRFVISWINNWANFHLCLICWKFK